MEPPRSLITREFYKPRGAKHLRYTFTATPDVLMWDNVADDTLRNLFLYLNQIFIIGEELPEVYESSSQALAPIPSKIEPCHGHYLTGYGFKGVGQSYNAHFAVQDCLARNDSNFVAYEVPVWAEPHETGNGAFWHGYIDYVALIPQEDGTVKILVADYKPNAAKEKHAHVQVYRYMVMLARRTKIPLSQFEGVYFDEKHAFKIYP